MYDKLNNGLNGKLFCPLGVEGQIKGGLTNGVHSINTFGPNKINLIFSTIKVCLIVEIFR